MLLHPRGRSRNAEQLLQRQMCEGDKQDSGQRDVKQLCPDCAQVRIIRANKSDSGALSKPRFCRNSGCSRSLARRTHTWFAARLEEHDHRQAMALPGRRRSPAGGPAASTPAGVWHGLCKPPDPISWHLQQGGLP